jgi:hypothetical protein
MWAAVAGPPSPSSPFFPPSPTTDVMMPVRASTMRITWLALSAMYRSPFWATATLWGQLNVASLAGTPSPEKLSLQSASFRGTYPPALPATVVMMPSAPTRRMIWLKVSTMYIVPAPSKVIIRGSFM